LILEAVKNLAEPLRSSVQVLFLGDGELREQINALARTEPSIRAQVLGFRNQRGLSEFFHASDLLILPSLHSETWGLVVNEALHHGLPCVVSEGVGSAPDLVHNGVTGAICQPGSAESLAQAIVGLLPILKRPETRDACRNTVASYGVEQAARGIANAFQDVLSTELNRN
jgi:glycosyltransferase involved in cell wall biosynthesis